MCMRPIQFDNIDLYMCEMGQIQPSTTLFIFFLSRCWDVHSVHHPLRSFDNLALILFKRALICWVFPQLREEASWSMIVLSTSVRRDKEMEINQIFFETPFDPIRPICFWRLCFWQLYVRQLSQHCFSSCSQACWNAKNGESLFAQS